MQNYGYQPADITDFSGGMTDDYINSSPKFAKTLENFYILNNKSIKTRPGTVLDSLIDPQIPLGTQRIQTLMGYDKDEKLFAHSAKKIFYRNPVSYASLLGPSGNNPFNLADANTYVAHTEWNRHLICTTSAYDKPVKIYKDFSGNYQVRTAGLPKMSEPALSGTSGANSYLYAFVYKYEYKIGDQTFIDFGPVTEVQAANLSAPNSNNITINSIPVLTNTSDDNYDTTNITKEIYRTINGGQVFYFVNSIANATTSYIDSASDDSIQDNESLYITGDIPDNDAPPRAIYCHTVNGYTYYAHFKEGTEIYPSKIRQSQKDDPDSVPASYEDQLEDEITGISSVQDIPIVGCRRHIYRIDNAFDEQGRGGMVHRRISDHAACLSHESFVQAEGGLFWFGVDGIYYTDGYKCTKVTDHLNKRYQAAVKTLAGKTRKIKGVYNENTRMLHWTVSFTEKASGLEECDSIWTIDLQWGISENICCFVWNGGAETFFPTALAVFDNELYMANKFGYVCRFDETVFTDPKIIPATDPNNWYKETIIWKYVSVASNFGTSFVRKIANKVLISAKGETNVSVAIKAINDDGKKTRQLTPIRWRKNFIWGDEEFIWGNNDCAWFYGGTIEVDRRFPAKGLRWNYLQLEITNDLTIVFNSDLMGLVSINPSLNTATLVDSASGDWPSQSVDYYLYLESDNFARAYKVLGRSNDTLTLEDINNTLVVGDYKWILKGYRKGEVLNLVGYSISWATLSRSQDTFNVGDNGALS